MPKFVHFDPASGAILNWMDTDAFSYAEMPGATSLLAVTNAQWDSKGTKAFRVALGALTDSLAPAPVEPLAGVKARLSTSVDDQVAAILQKFTRFQVEYTPREAAAREFKAASYVGDAGTWVSSFATAAGKTPKDAADLIIQQADAMYAALPVLGALRMRKYEIAAAASAANAQAIHDDILARATAAVAGL
jgi:hypothetical protein